MDDSSLPNGGAATDDLSSAARSDDEAILRKQVDLLTGELHASASRIADLEAELLASTAEAAASASRIADLEAELRVLDAVAARASALEGDVISLQEEIDAATASAEEARSELERARSELKEASRRRAAAEAASAGLEQRAAAAEAGREAAEAEAAARQGRVRELEALLGEEREKHGAETRVLGERIDRLAVDSREKDVFILEAQRAAEEAVAELREELGSACNVKSRGSCFGKGWRLGNSWAVAAASVATVGVVTGTVYLHLSRRR